ncbi:major capsid protein [Sphingomonas dokdonensis]|uniref:Phage major capsid protein E n=1 Tax=Sphingomonas dokdonensis TaxID=344880 RepID=A0A245ZHJ3_9SPHN|nr:major capsid protein [Sphingomonas dokdonensis]OWK29203.1 phage major capsid protein E [Sphingomonas dokdonensis]
MIDLYAPTELIAMIEPLRVPGNFLRRLLYSTATPIYFDTPDIKWDRVFDDLRIAPFVSPYAPGKPRQDRGFQTESFTPGYLKPLDRVDPTKFSKRRPGEAIGGELSLADRRDLMMLDYLLGHKRQLERRDEVMAAEIVRTGRVTIAGEDYPTAVVDFGRDASLTKALLNTSRWGESGVSPVADVAAWLDEVATIVGAAPSHVIFDRKSWALFQADNNLDRVIDLTMGQTNSSVMLGFTPGAPGAPVFKGRIGTVELYVYNDTYEDVDGSIKALLPDFTVIVVAPGAYEGTPTYGAILDPRAGYIATPWFSKNWIDENPPAEWVLTQSAPLPIPKRPNASLCVTVR